MSFWTDDRVDTLSRLWRDGLSARQVAAALGGGISRNAVLSKVHRLGLSIRGKTEGIEMRMAMGTAPVVKVREHSGKNNNPSGYGANKARSVPPKQAARHPEPPAPPTALLIPLIALNGPQCCWPIGDPGAEGFGFCGVPKMAGERAYCEFHRLISIARRP